MTGERMNQIYCMTGLNAEPDLRTQEEKDFYDKLIKDMEKQNKENPGGVWYVPGE